MAQNSTDLDDDAFWSALDNDVFDSLCAATATNAAVAQTSRASLCAAAATNAAVAQTSRAKRLKPSTTVATGAGGPDRPIDVPEGPYMAQNTRPINVPEGPYMAAIRGFYSTLRQQMNEGGAGGAAVGQGSAWRSAPRSALCWTCGGRGHWTNDCSQDGGRGDVPEKACPCGIGSCLVVMSTTVGKNLGRMFYRCPQLDSGGCHYFDWCDSPSSASPAFSAPRGAPTHESNTRGGGAPSYESDSTVPNINCQCGAGPCLVLTANTKRNFGRQFYSCPNKEDDQSCNFCIWCDEYTSADARPT